MTSHRTFPKVMIGALLLTALAGVGAVASGPQEISLPIRGIVRPLNQASMSIDLPVRVVKLNRREAQSFRKGDVLVTFDCERQRAEHTALVAVHREMKLVLEGNTYLDRRGAVGKMDVEVSRARVSKAEAEAAALAARLKQCQVIAPFDGRIAELKVNEHEIPASGQPFISIVDETSFEIDLIVPSQWLRILAVGMPFRFVIDETGMAYEAKVHRIGAAVDPVSQTIKIIAVFAHAYRGVLAGMSGSAAFSSKAVVR